MSEHSEQLQNLINIQCTDGNWNYDPYMHGLANGLILAKAIFAGEEVRFLEAPEEWLADKVNKQMDSFIGEDV